MRTGRAVAYIRVSSRSQDHAMQRSAIERLASFRNDAVREWYAERRSAKTMERAELARLLENARTGRLRGRRLYLFRLDRLTRTGIADTLTTLETLRRAGVDIVSVADGFDLNGPHAEVIVAVMAWAAKMERLAINERIAAARDRIEAEGGRWGRPRRVDVETICRARAMQKAGKSIRRISSALKIPRSTLAGALAASAKASGKDVVRKGPRKPSRSKVQSGADV
jgi:DNA invertase Pin-like site-specific DNA recombinase